MREPIERHGGQVEKFIGDAVMAVFGVPQVHEDDALRAVRAAAEMREAVDALNAELGAGLQIRIGVNSGEVVAGEGATTLVTGDAVNTAKRLEEAAGAGEILISDATRHLVENATELEACRPDSGEGQEGAARDVARARDDSGSGAVRPPPRRAARRTRARARVPPCRARRGRARSLVPPRHRLRRRRALASRDWRPSSSPRCRPAPACLKARCLPYGDGITFLPLTELIRSAGSEETIMATVAAETDGALIVDRVRGAMGNGGAPSSSEETFWAIRRLLETVARARPLVVCFEDVHWAEPMFLDLIEYIAGWSRGAPILLLCLARPDLLDERPRWGGAAVALEPLTEHESETLLDELAAEWPIPPAARTAIAAAAEGNPLFVEQMVAMLAEDGVTDHDPAVDPGPAGGPTRPPRAARAHGARARRRGRQGVLARRRDRAVADGRSDGGVGRAPLTRPQGARASGELGFSR